jgi:hypothetical protein
MLRGRHDTWFRTNKREEKIMKRLALLMMVVTSVTLLASTAAWAIINGQPDGTRHPYVGLVYNAQASCSGTLISPTVFLTAGHCTEFFEQGDSRVYITFEPNAEFDPAKAHPGIPYTHPGYDYPVNDVGVVVLDQPVAMPDGYGKLPKAHLVDTLDKGQRLSLVGYGAQGFQRGGGASVPAGDPTRSVATVRYIGTKGVSNTIGKDQDIKTREASAGRGGEGSCYGDSGGPYFLADQKTLMATSSFGTPLGTHLCTGVGYAQRADLPGVLRWIHHFL